MQEKYGVQVLRTPADILTEFLKTWDKIAKREADKNPFFKKVLESQREYAAWSCPRSGSCSRPTTLRPTTTGQDELGRSASETEGGRLVLARPILGRLCMAATIHVPGSRLAGPRKLKHGSRYERESRPAWSDFDAIDRFTSITGQFFAWIFVVPLVAVASFEVVARYGFHAPTIFALDLTYMCYGALFMLCAALHSQRGAYPNGHVVGAVLRPNERHGRPVAYVLSSFPGC